MFTRIRVTAFVAGLTGCVSVALGGGIATTIDADVGGNPKAFWQSFMTELYGPYDKAKKCWVSAEGSDHFCMRPNTLQTVMIGGAAQHFISVSGAITLPDGDNSCHACNGNLGLFILAADGKKLVIAAQGKKHQVYGSYGRSPGEDDVTTAKISNSGKYGFIVKQSDFGQGLNYGTATVQGAVGSDIRALGTFVTQFDDHGKCENETCSDYSFELSFDTEKDGRFAPVILRGTGIRAGEVFSGTFVAPFDEASFLYNLPDGLPDEVK